MPGVKLDAELSLSGLTPAPGEGGCGASVELNR